MSLVKLVALRVLLLVAVVTTAYLFVGNFAKLLIPLYKALGL